jgi:hypothetical protein
VVLPNVAGPVIRPGMRAAGLSRLSRETQETTSPERQRRLHLRLARNYELHYDPRPYAEGGDLYEDIDFSAYNLRRPRPAFENLMRRLDHYDDVGRPRPDGVRQHLEPREAAYEAIAQVGRWKGVTPTFGASIRTAFFACVSQLTYSHVSTAIFLE